MDLNVLAARRRHFDAREGHTYCVRLYLDYQDGDWPEVHTAVFAAGTHEWEQKTIRVHPSRPVKTALVLVEFHQPQGKAWFDDLSLTQADRPDKNLLACPGFEEDDPAAGAAQSFGADYEKTVESLLRDARAARQFSELEGQVDALSSWIEAKGIAPHYRRELRDLDDVKKTLGVCRRL